MERVAGSCLDFGAQYAWICTTEDGRQFGGFTNDLHDVTHYTGVEVNDFDVTESTLRKCFT